MTKYIKYVLGIEPDPRHLGDAGDLRQPFTDLGFCGQPFNTAISFLTRVSGLFCTTKGGALIEFNENTSVLLQNVDASLIEATDFVSVV
ncbi:hypothetical protein [Baaleninema simplex]|uniref:hypothetical protein n=1 Tax=Baaleninema simplex TaxID=2862350 RepID=UPI0011819D71|nr:hypothetical protein [Baaleninema simplex]